MFVGFFGGVVVFCFVFSVFVLVFEMGVCVSMAIVELIMEDRLACEF